MQRRSHISSGKRLLTFATCAALAMSAWLSPALYANLQDDLEGTPETSPGCIVYKATVTPGQSYENVYGVRDNTDATHYGEVNINEGTVAGTVYGCRAISGDELTKSSCNLVKIFSGTVGTVYGGYAYGGSHNASVHQNTVDINGGSVNMYVYGGNADGSTLSVTGNNVSIKNAYVGKTVYGGCAFNTASWLSMLRNNVVIDNTIVSGSVYGGYASGSATASNTNNVTIKGDSIINGSVYGGYALSSNSDAKNNTVHIEGGTLKNHIYGGIGRNATGNTIVIKGGNLSEADLYGYSDGRKSHGANTLEVWTPNMTIRSAQNFENYYFIVSDEVVNSDTYMINALKPVNLEGTTIGLGFKNGTVLTRGDRINLIDNAENNGSAVSLAGKELQGGTLFTAFTFSLEVVSSDNPRLVVIFEEAIEPDPGRPLQGPEPGGGGANVLETAKSLVAGRSATSTLLAEGSDLAMGKAMTDAAAAFENASANGNNIAAFVTLGGESSSYFTAPYLRMLSGSTVAGVAIRNAAVFFETGYGNFETFTSLDTASVFGEGNSQYYGGGLMINLDLETVKGLNLKAIARMGGVSSNWSTDDLTEAVAFGTGSMYMGSALEAGYQMQSGNFGCGVFGNGTWTHLNGEEADVNGEQVAYEGTDFFKTRLGATASYEAGIVKASIEAAWEHGFNTTSNASVNELDFDFSSLSGNTGVLELGATLKPQNASWQFDLSATGYIGARRGIAGSAYFTMSF